MLQVQQFKKESKCDRTASNDQICGTYNCQQQDTLLKRLEFHFDPEPLLEEQSKVHQVQRHAIVKKGVKYKSQSNTLKTFAFILLGSTISGSIYAAFRLLCCSRLMDRGRHDGPTVSNRKESNRSTVTVGDVEAQPLTFFKVDDIHERPTGTTNFRIDNDESTVDGAVF